MPTSTELKTALTEAQKAAAAAAKAVSDAVGVKKKKEAEKALSEAQKNVDAAKAAHKAQVEAEKKAAKAPAAPAPKSEVLSKEAAATMAAETGPTDPRVIVDFSGTGKESQSIAVAKGTRVQDALKEIGWSMTNIKLSSKTESGGLREISLADPITSAMKITVQAKSAGG